MLKSDSFLYLALAGLVFTQGGCAHSLKTNGKIESLDVGAVEIRLVADTDFKEVTRYVSKSVEKQMFASGKKPIRKTESVEFTVESKISTVDIEKNRLFLSNRTIQKTGQGDLHEFAMPEMGEEIITEMDQYARIYSAGSYPPSSIFFVPPISLPDEPVKKGDTWSMHSEWVSLGNQAPFELELTSTLKDVIRCGEYRCADIEVSGRAAIIGVNERKIRFTSRVQGRILFILERGSVLWSIMRGTQQLSSAEQNFENSNCFLSLLEEPKALKWSAVKAKTCDPTGDLPVELEKIL